MFFFFLHLGLSTIIGSNIDCGYTFCTGECDYDDEMVESQAYQCYDTETLKSFCLTFTYLPMCMAIFIVPTVICTLWACCLEVRPPICTFITCFIYNILWSCIVCGIYCCASLHSPKVVHYIIIMVPAFLIIAVGVIGLCYCPNCTSCGAENAPKYLISNMNQRWASREELEQIIVEAKQNPPILTLTGVARYGENMGAADQFNVGSKYDQPIQELIPYESWEEYSPDVEIPKGKVIKAKFRIEYEADAAINEYIRKRKIEISEGVKQQIGKADNFDVIYSVYNSRTYTLGFYDKEPCFFKFCRKGGKFFWGLFVFLGYHAVLETIWCAHIKVLEVFCRKRISGEPGYRAPMNTLDLKAELISNPVTKMEP